MTGSPERPSQVGLPAASSKSERDSLGTWLVALLGLVFYALRGLDGPLQEANAVLAYQAVRMLDGVPPYLSLYDVKAPLAVLLGGASAFAGSLVGADEVLSIRVGYLLLAAATVGAVYALAFACTRSRAAAILAAVALLGMEGFSVQAAWGPRFKTAGAFFVALGMLHAWRREHVRAGLFATCAALVWQPLGLLLVGCTAAAIGRDFLRSSGRVALGACAAVVPVLLYFAFHGALQEFAEGTLLHHLQYGSSGRPEESRLLSVVSRTYAPNLPVLLGGLVGLLLLGARSLRNEGERFLAVAVLILPTLGWIAWSTFDFQGEADLFPLLPPVCIGFAVLGSRLADRFPGRGRGFARPVFAIAGLLVLAILGAGFVNSDDRTAAKLARRHPARLAFYEKLAGDPEIGHLFQPGARTLAFGGIATLVELEMVAVSPYTQLSFGISDKIEAEHEGGLAGWLHENLVESAPNTVLLENFPPPPAPPSLAGQDLGELLPDWILHRFKLARKHGGLGVFVRRDLMDS